ncbi:hypothetical protein FPP74_11110 [Corynebacterium sp. NML180780]|nr:hypothetical protein FPP74_11110 [Corynebacterium sp. NML180780]
MKPMFTALHSALGIAPTDEFTNEMLDRLVEERIAERQDLDFKEKIDSKPTRPESDVKKDLCAMANSGGGVIVYGVGELSDMKDHAGKRVSAGDYSPRLGAGLPLCCHRLHFAAIAGRGVSPGRASRTRSIRRRGAGQ